jgi:hypothetical protein
MAANERSKERLKNELKEEVTKLFESALDYAEVACPKETYKALRSKILRVGNNCIRNTEKRLQKYEVEFIPQTEEIIEIKR